MTVFNSDHQNELRCWRHREQMFSLAMGAYAGIPEFSMNAGLSPRTGEAFPTDRGFPSVNMGNRAISTELSWGPRDYRMIAALVAAPASLHPVLVLSALSAQGLSRATAPLRQSWSTT